MRICLLNGGFDTAFSTADELLDRYWHVPRLAAALAGLGHEVTALQAFHRDESRRCGNALVELVGGGREQRPGWVELGFDNVRHRLESADPAVLHVFGLTLLPLCRAAGRWCRLHDVAATASYHGAAPRRNPLAAWRQRHAFDPFGAFFFPTEPAAEAFRTARIVGADATVVVAPEVSSPFDGIPQQEARRHLGVDGMPLFAWAGRLHPMKDPLTMLEAMPHILAKWPDARLAMAFQGDDMLRDIHAVLARDDRLRDSVVLLGKISHRRMEALFSAADFFVHTSLKEIGSNVLVEALSCGAIPVVTDLPSLRELTRRVGPAQRFEAGNAAELAKCLLQFDIARLGELSRQVKNAFRDHLSYGALAARYSEAFERLTTATSGSPQ